jgi:trehalose 6-phosphate synthase/phosphatase
MSQRLFIISNRLPIQAETKDNKIKLSLSSGGLVSAISSYIEFAEKEGKDNYEKYWVGVPGCSAGEWSTAAEQLNNSPYSQIKNPVMDMIMVFQIQYCGHFFIISLPM